MKAAPFAYVRPATLAEAVAELAAGDGDAKVLAGGQSLVPMLAMRLARPATLVDLGAVAALTVLRRDGDVLEVGAMVRQRELEHSAEAAAVPLLGMALPWVGHRELRSRGTVGGSIAHADPAAELPAVAACLDAELRVTGPDGERIVPAREFVTGALSTDLGPAEVLTSVRFPVARPGDGHGFGEVARRHGDFALAGVAVRVRGDEAVLTAFGVSDRPVTRDATDLLRGDDRPRAAAVLAAEMVDTAGDVHGSADYRRHLLAGLIVRELAAAAGEEQT
jgi:2-furoyl-CoA dehydrogenase FAD binding subunit